MRLLEEMEGRTGVRARLVACECSDEDCVTVWVYMQVRQAEVSRERYWLALGFGTVETMREQAAFLCSDLPDDGVRPAEQIDRGVAAVGRTWEQLLDLEVAARQLFSWERLPAEIEALQPEMVWRVRAIAFGEPFTRVARACEALVHYYAPDGPVDPVLIVGREER